MRNRIDVLSDIYNKLYDWGWPIGFFSFIGILVATGITHNQNIFIIGSIALTVFYVFMFGYMWLYPFDYLGERFNLWIHSFSKYKLSENEVKLWDNIMNKADKGYIEWLSQTQGDDICGPWIKDYTEEEGKLIDKIHEYFYGEHWYITMPISASQCYYQMFYAIKDKIKL
jgi:hypothetical protein